jgi:A/G-specific adenine glycosylase
LVIKTDDKLCVEKRGTGDIWANLYQFPLLETIQDESIEQVIQSEIWQKLFDGKKIEIDSVSNILLHQLTHQKLHIRFWNISTDKIIEGDKYLIIKESEIQKYPVPKPIENYLKKNGLNIGAK